VDINGDEVDEIVVGAPMFKLENQVNLNIGSSRNKASRPF